MLLGVLLGVLLAVLLVVLLAVSLAVLLAVFVVGGVEALLGEEVEAGGGRNSPFDPQLPMVEKGWATRGEGFGPDLGSFDFSQTQSTGTGQCTKFYKAIKRDVFNPCLCVLHSPCFNHAALPATV